jgi:hypothetical protein
VGRVLHLASGLAELERPEGVDQEGQLVGVLRTATNETSSLCSAAHPDWLGDDRTPKGRADRTGAHRNRSLNATARAPTPIVGDHETALAGAIHNEARGKTMDRIIEEESGTYTPRSVHPHNGYYAGDFTAVPFRKPTLQRIPRRQRHLQHIDQLAGWTVTAC